MSGNFSMLLGSMAGLLVSAAVLLCRLPVWVIGDLITLKVPSEDTIPAGAGSCVHVLSGTLHTFKNVGTSPSRLLGILTPGGFEKFSLKRASQRRRGPLRPRASRTWEGFWRSARGMALKYRHPRGTRQVFGNTHYRRTSENQIKAT